MFRKKISDNFTGAYEGGHPWGGRALLILHLLAFPFHRQSTFNIALHCTHIKKIKKRNKMYSD